MFSVMDEDGRVRPSRGQGGRLERGSGKGEEELMRADKAKGGGGVMDNAVGRKAAAYFLDTARYPYTGDCI